MRDGSRSKWPKTGSSLLIGDMKNRHCCRKGGKILKPLWNKRVWTYPSPNEEVTVEVDDPDGVGIDVFVRS